MTSRGKSSFRPDERVMRLSRTKKRRRNRNVVVLFITCIIDNPSVTVLYQSMSWHRRTFCPSRRYRVGNPGLHRILRLHPHLRRAQPLSNSNIRVSGHSESFPVSSLPMAVRRFIPSRPVVVRIRDSRTRCGAILAFRNSRPGREGTSLQR